MKIGLSCAVLSEYEKKQPYRHNPKRIKQNEPWNLPPEVLIQDIFIVQKKPVNAGITDIGL
jgi:hypothetical protein